ncbi:MAG: AMP-binding protein [Pseudomonadota bacterium]
MSQEMEGLFSQATYGELFARAMARNGDRLALTDGETSLTYAELGDAIGAVAQFLAGIGLKPGDGLAQLSANKIEAVIVIGAAFLAGLRYTPLHPLGAADDHLYILDDANIACLVVDEERFAERARDLKARSASVLNIFSHGSSAFPRLPDWRVVRMSGGFAPRGRAEEIALIAYTGGTTGKPKGVIHRHRSLIANLFTAMAEWEWPADPRFLAVTPISHAAFLFMLPVFLKGGLFAVRPTFVPGDFAQFVKAWRISTTFLVPTMIYKLLDSADFADGDLSSLETVIYGAAPISPSRLEQAMARFGPVFSQLYGQTEAPNAISMLFKRDHLPVVEGRLSSCGVPIGDSIVSLRSEESEVPAGEIGELCVRGPLVMDGYWKKPDETAEALRGGWLHTGDMAIMNEAGFITLVDRKKDLIISGGFNIYPREVEEALSSHPAVKECCVVGAPDEKWGESVVAVVVSRTEADQEQLIQHVKSRKGVLIAPKRIVFVEALPMTSLGKIDRKAVREQFWTSIERRIN